MLAGIKTIALFLSAFALAIAAFLVPSHIRAIDPLVLKLAAAKDASNTAKINQSIDAGQVGPAQWIIAATKPEASIEKSSKERIAELLRNNPELAISGGPAPDYIDFLQFIQKKASAETSDTAVISILLPRAERASLSDLLSESSNANVRALLSIRNIGGLIRLHPADHAAGAPYDAGILTLALLCEGGYFEPALAQRIGSIASIADTGSSEAIQAIEDIVIATLSLGRQLDFRSMANLASISKTPGDWAQMATLFRAHPTRIAEIYTALVFNDDSGSLYRYLSKHAPSGNSDLDTALRYGTGATKALVASDRPLYHPRATVESILSYVARYRPDFFINLSLENPFLANTLKLCLLLISGFFIALSLGNFFRSIFNNSTRPSPGSPMPWIRDALFSFVLVISIWSLFEPEILKSENTGSSQPPRIEFAVASTLESLQSPVKAMQELNQVTLLVLALFFIIQLIIYTFCLIKVKEIARQKLSPIMKIRLLENEENLFDFGLYVGLGGTVLSLILVAVGIVEASLMAAYASTLFGILFTAVLKVLNLRPYRRKLIIESGVDAQQSGALMKNIEL